LSSTKSTLNAKQQQQRFTTTNAYFGCLIAYFCLSYRRSRWTRKNEKLESPKVFVTVEDKNVNLPNEGDAPFKFIFAESNFSCKRLCCVAKEEYIFKLKSVTERKANRHSISVRPLCIVFFIKLQFKPRLFKKGRGGHTIQ